MWGTAVGVPEQDAGGGLTGVSCTSATNCTALGDTGVSSTYVTSTLVPGGAITLQKSTGLYGHYTESVSGSGWRATNNTSVTLYECGTAYYTQTTCNANTSAAADVVATGAKAGTFKSTYRLRVGVIDSQGNTCGLAHSGACYIVAIGNTGSYASKKLGSHPRPPLSPSPPPSRPSTSIR